MWDYVRALIRQNIHKHDKSISRFQPQPGQDPDEAAAVLAAWQRQQDFRHAVLEWANENRIDAR